ncbi:uncharacterized protein LOC135172055 isoform X1 [Diachasmimorpha longicaudata]|uniref:uncharacterized protein LOC135172055 isoform X1 n=1 Tax=Diachasmimorpha longicaudata TaxID=58733 RepID=UPI0030B8A8CB
MYDIIQPKQNVHREIKAKVTSICGGFRRLEEIVAKREKGQRARGTVTPVSAAPQPTRSRIDSETPTKDTNVEEDRQIRVGIRRKRSKGSPGTQEREDQWKNQADAARRGREPLFPRCHLPSQPPRQHSVGKGDEEEIKEEGEEDWGERAWEEAATPSERKKEKWEEEAEAVSPGAPVKPDALIVRPAAREKYCDILRRVKKEAPREQAECVRRIRRTATGCSRCCSR